MADDSVLHSIIGKEISTNNVCVVHPRSFNKTLVINVLQLLVFNVMANSLPFVLKQDL